MHLSSTCSLWYQSPIYSCADRRDTKCLNMTLLRRATQSARARAIVARRSSLVECRLSNLRTDRRRGQWRVTKSMDACSRSRVHPAALQRCSGECATRRARMSMLIAVAAGRFAHRPTAPTRSRVRATSTSARSLTNSAPPQNFTFSLHRDARLPPLDAS